MVWQYRPQWNTESGGLGYSVLHAADAMSGAAVQAWVDDVRELFSQAFSTIVPSGITVTFPGEAVRVDTQTGQLFEVEAVTAPAAVAGVAAGAYSAPTGGRIRWNTSGIVGGRRVAGTTFIVPIGGGGFQDDGTLAASTITQFQAAAAGYISAMAGQAVVWSRPWTDPSGTEPTRWGTEHVIVSATVPDRAAVLRSRRD